MAAKAGRGCDRRRSGVSRSTSTSLALPPALPAAPPHQHEGAREACTWKWNVELEGAPSASTARARARARESKERESKERARARRPALLLAL